MSLICFTLITNEVKITVYHIYGSFFVFIIVSNVCYCPLPIFKIELSVYFRSLTIPHLF